MSSEQKVRRERRVGLILTVAALVLAFGSLLMLRFVISAHRVPTSAMIPTIHPHDRAVMYKLAYRFGAKPQIDDVIVYREGKYNFVFRVVAGPGDTIEMRDNVVFLNGKRREEPYIVLTPDIPALRTFGPVTVPAGHYFTLGDNRDNANDSRFRGFVPEEQIRGRMFYVNHQGECTE